ncbi:hypothetical protein HDU76_004158 [Blyttiomyces sp. JEL0837]|nr:hypothetical protein HDU76_004158 [Blyttiomyces sp. JEL0837]
MPSKLILPTPRDALSASTTNPLTASSVLPSKKDSTLQENENLDPFTGSRSLPSKAVKQGEFAVPATPQRFKKSKDSTVAASVAEARAILPRPTRGASAAARFPAPAQAPKQTRLQQQRNAAREAEQQQQQQQEDDEEQQNQQPSLPAPAVNNELQESSLPQGDRKHPFKTFTFYFQNFDQQDSAAMTKQAQMLRGSVSKFFNKGVTHVVTNEQKAPAPQVLLPFPAKKGQPPLRTSKRGNNSVEPPAGVNAVVTNALNWGMQVWSQKEFNAEFERYGKRPVEAPRGLKDHLKEEKMYGLSTSRDSENGFIPFKGRFLLVEDATDYHRPVIIKEFERHPEDESKPPWPKIYYESRKPGSVFIPPVPGDDDDFEDEDDEAGNNGGGVLGNNRGQGHSLSHSSDKESDMKGDDDDGEGEGDSDDAESDDHVDHESEDGDDESLRVDNNSNASGLNNTTSMIPKDTIPVGKKVQLLMKRRVVNKQLEGGKVGGAHVVGGKVTKRSANASAAKREREKAAVIKRTSKPKGKDFYYRPGFCENCGEKYDEFITHVTSRKHASWASYNHNFINLDELLIRTHRDGKIRRPPSWPSLDEMDEMEYMTSDEEDCDDDDNDDNDDADDVEDQDKQKGPTEMRDPNCIDEQANEADAQVANVDQEVMNSPRQEKVIDTIAPESVPCRGLISEKSVEQPVRTADKVGFPSSVTVVDSPLFRTKDGVSQKTYMCEDFIIETEGVRPVCTTNIPVGDNCEGDQLDGEDEPVLAADKTVVIEHGDIEETEQEKQADLKSFLMESERRACEDGSGIESMMLDKVDAVEACGDIAERAAQWPDPTEPNAIMTKANVTNRPQLSILARMDCNTLVSAFEAKLARKMSERLESFGGEKRRSSAPAMQVSNAEQNLTPTLELLKKDSGVDVAVQHLFVPDASNPFGMNGLKAGGDLEVETSKAKRVQETDVSEDLPGPKRPRTAHSEECPKTPYTKPIKAVSATTPRVVVSFAARNFELPGPTATSTAVKPHRSPHLVRRHTFHAMPTTPKLDCRIYISNVVRPQELQDLNSAEQNGSPQISFKPVPVPEVFAIAAEENSVAKISTEVESSPLTSLGSPVNSSQASSSGTPHQLVSVQGLSNLEKLLKDENRSLLTDSNYAVLECFWNGQSPPEGVQVPTTRIPISEVEDDDRKIVFVELNWENRKFRKKRKRVHGDGIVQAK